MRRLMRTSDGVFVRDGETTYILGQVPDADLFEAVKADKLSATGVVSGHILAPVIPDQLLLVGMNYESHGAEFGMPAPPVPIMGDSSGTAVVAQNSTVAPPADWNKFVDYEGEIAIIIGKTCEKVSEEDASQYVLGLTACIDLSLRDMLFKALLNMRKGKTDGPTMGDSKTFPGSKPLGPEILLTDGMDLRTLDLPLTTHVNGVQKQTGNASEMIFSIAKLVSHASQQKVLNPGDIISSGTPGGVGLAEGVFLEAGDVVEVTLGALEPLKVTIA
jgi:2-keto-4-pentenoate hydratase/2-oxohepta-3-ene-1,7-dioic acid hydratase in catechol pathway